MSIAAIQHENKVVAAFLLTLLGGLLLPVVPLWVGLMPLVAVAAMVVYGNFIFSPAMRAALIVSAVAIALLMAAANIGGAMASPVTYLKALFALHGAEFPLIAGFIAMVYTAILIGMLGCFCYYESTHRTGRRFVLLLLLFAFLYHFPTLVAALRCLFDASDNNLAELATESSALIKWNSWVLGALLAFLLSARNPGFTPLVLRTIVVAAVCVAALIIAQHVLGEYFYVLEAPSFSDYEFKARATYVYHAPAAWLMAMALVILLTRRYALCFSKELLPLALLCLALYLNSTRAINVSLAGAVAVLFCIHVWCRSGKCMPLLCLAVAALFAGHIFHVKVNINVPQAGETEKLPENMQQYLGAIQKETKTTPLPIKKKKIETFIRSNNPRVELMQEGTNLLKHSWIGQGVGNISIPLSGYYNNGKLTAWSSHSFIVDVGIAAGVPAMIVLLALSCWLMLLALWRLLTSRGHYLPATQQLSAIVVCVLLWMIVSGFLPQEANFLLNAMFILLALLARQLMAPVEAPAVSLPRWHLNAERVGMLGAAVWCMAWSASVAMPLAELAMLRKANPDSAQEKIYTNSGKIAWLSRNLLPGGMGHIELLPENPDAAQDMWLIWDPAYDKDYAGLITRFGINYNRGYGHYPVFNLPRGWQVVSKVQPTISIIHNGRSSVTIDDEQGTRDGFYADFARWSHFLNLKGQAIKQLSDGHFTSFWRMWPGENTIIIDSGLRYQLDAYTLTIAHHHDLKPYKNLSWELQGSNDLKKWQALDKRRNVDFTGYELSERYFYTRNPGFFRYYRFSFAPARTLPDYELLLSDMKLYSKQKPKAD